MPPAVPRAKLLAFMESAAKTHFYLTTAIDYSNGPPHLGHASEKVLADVLARSRRMMGQPVHFLTGLDEHGTKVQQSAQRLGTEPQAYVDSIAPLFRKLCEQLLISNDDFIRTTEPRHKKVVQRLLMQLWEAGDIYLAEYAGFYSVRQEQFVLEKEKDEAGNWPEIYGEVTEITEANYFFRLSKYQDWLVAHLKSHDFVVPRFRQKQVEEFLKEPVNDLCISRPKERLSWGIELPFDPAYVTYVWFDALINYISAVQPGSEAFLRYWPCDYHVIGKDILVPSHAVYWPIMLHALGIEPPKQLLVHGFWSVNGQRMSKSTGNYIDPFELTDEFGPDAVRYFLTREMSVGQDSNFTKELFLNRYNGELAGNLGNLLSRLLNMADRYASQGLAAPQVSEQPEVKLRAAWEEFRVAITEAYRTLNFHTAVERAFAFSSEINAYVDTRAPWKLAKSDLPADQATLQTSLAVIAEGLRLTVTALAPVMPATHAKVHQLLGITAPETWAESLAWGESLTGRVLGSKTILFPKPETPESL